MSGVDFNTYTDGEIDQDNGAIEDCETDRSELCLEDENEGEREDGFQSQNLMIRSDEHFLIVSPNCLPQCCHMLE